MKFFSRRVVRRGWAKKQEKVTNFGIKGDAGGGRCNFESEGQYYKICRKTFKKKYLKRIDNDIDKEFENEHKATTR